MTTPKLLSPAAQAVLFAYAITPGVSPRIGAALRAAAEQMIKTDDLTDMIEDQIRGAERQRQAKWLYTIATELDGVNG